MVNDALGDSLLKQRTCQAKELGRFGRIVAGSTKEFLHRGPDPRPVGHVAESFLLTLPHPFEG
jgi:hypothetical protein